MPELPEVELMTRDLRSWGQGRRIAEIELLDPRLQTGDVSPSGLVGRTLERVRRRGKYCVASAGDQELVLHFRMTGKLVLFQGLLPAFARAAFRFSGGAEVAFVDRRRLGDLRVLGEAELRAFLDQRLGPEPWPEQRDAAWWGERMAGTRAAIKVALMDQARVAGLGNIAGSEICFRAGIDPRTPTPRLRPRHWEAVAAATHGWVDDTLTAEQGSEIVLVEEGRHAPNPFAVYGREGQPCPRCAAPLRRVVQSGRSTFFCAGCQRRLRTPRTAERR